MATDRELGVIDAHVRAGAPDALPEHLGPLLTQHGVNHAVLVQPSRSMTETERALALAAKTPFVAAVSAWIDLTAPGLSETLDRLTTDPKLKGVCLPLEEEEPKWLLQETVVQGLQAVAELGLVADLLLRPVHLPAVAVLAAANPALRVVVGHIGKPFIAAGHTEPWSHAIARAAEYPNVYCKVSGLVTEDAQPGWRLAHLRPFVETVVRCFGYDRLLFGSDWPAFLPSASYAQVLEAAVEAAGPMSPGQRARFLSGTASELYRLG